MDEELRGHDYLRQLRMGALRRLQDANHLEHPALSLLTSCTGCLVFLVVGIGVSLFLNFVLRVPDDFKSTWTGPISIAVFWILGIVFQWFRRTNKPDDNRKALEVTQPIYEHYRSQLSDDELMKAISSGDALKVQGASMQPCSELTKDTAKWKAADRTCAMRYGSFVDTYEQVLKHYGKEPLPPGINQFKWSIFTVDRHKLLICLVAIALADCVLGQRTDLATVLGVPSDEQV